MTKTKTSSSSSSSSTGKPSSPSSPPVLSKLPSSFHLEVLEGGKVFQGTNFLSPTDCDSLVDLAEEFGFKKSPVTGGGHGRTGREDARTNSYTVIEDQQLADELWNRVKGVVPQDLCFLLTSPYFTERGGTEWRPVGVVERLRFYRYEKGECYPEHMDGSYRRAVATKRQQHVAYSQQQSFLTLLVYLNEGFEGGETEFFPEKQHCRFLRDVEVKTPTVRVTPQKGAALINVHHTLHQGCEVVKGVKYVLRTDIVYERAMTVTPDMGKNTVVLGNGQATATQWEKIFEPSCKVYHD